jgi:RimJ/RimL family protein N-acetyltransferase
MRESVGEVIATGDNVVLRDRVMSDLECHLRWLCQGEWRTYDAPWEVADLAGTEEARQRYRERFLESCREEKVTPRKRATITTNQGTPLGWVTRYGDHRFSKVWAVGINICEDKYLNKGMGTEALALWVSHLFKHSDIHRISLKTWSLNPRMKHVAEKLGFVFEGAEREMLEWKAEWLNRLHYGLLRSEWDELRARGAWWKPYPKRSAEEDRDG